MKQLKKGETYPFDAFPLEKRVDLVSSLLQVFYCAFPVYNDNCVKYGLFKNNLKRLGLESSITKSYTVIGDYFGYDEIKVCPIGIFPANLCSLVALITKDPERCQVVSLDYQDACHVIMTGNNLQECLDAIKESTGLNLHFMDLIHYDHRKRAISEDYGCMSGDVSYLHFQGKYEFQYPPNHHIFDGVKSLMVEVKKSNGKYNYLNLDTETELSPVDFDSYSSMTHDSHYQIMLKKKGWIDADMKGVFLKPSHQEKGWYSYDCLQDYLAGNDISSYKQDQYNEHRSRYQHVVDK